MAAGVYADLNSLVSNSAGASPQTMLGWDEVLG